jgi:hypothetical protein
LTQHARWDRLLAEFDILQRAIADFDQKIWADALRKTLFLEEPTAFEASFGDVSTTVWNSVTFLGKLRHLNLKRGDQHLGLLVQPSNKKHFVPYQISATLGEACSLLSTVQIRWDLTKFTPVKL